jgi:hypothetical protein
VGQVLAVIVLVLAVVFLVLHQLTPVIAGLLILLAIARLVG